MTLHNVDWPSLTVEQRKAKLEEIYPPKNWVVYAEFDEDGDLVTLDAAYQVAMRQSDFEENLYKDTRK